MDIIELYQEFLLSDGICIDSRKLKHNQIFIALPGSKVNGHEYALAAILSGARLALVEDKQLTTLDKRCIYTHSTIIILQSLAKHHRAQLKIPIIGITGSVGKTTTKELVSKVLASKYNVTSTQGNLNNHIGVPLSILSINEKTEMAMIEMGANHIGEIAELCDIAQPTHGLITRIGKAHLEGFGNLDGVIKAKSELYQYLTDHQGTAFVNDEDELLMQVIAAFEMNKICIHQKIKGTILSSDPFLRLNIEIEGKSLLLNMNLPGKYNFDNILMAIAVGHYFNIDPDKIKSSLESYIQGANRSQHIHHSTNEYILDAYNANPLSMSEAIKSFQAWNTNKKKILILGEMKELGESREPEHQKIIDLINQFHWDRICLVGPSFNALGKDKDHLYFNDVQALKLWYNNNTFNDTVFLIKGSRSLTLEKMMDHLIPDSAH